jgi:tetratricopeptide (TPR) repeat protein
MAPEQARGAVELVDRRADVFGLGSILCEVLTGQPAYTGRNSTEVLRKALDGDTADACARLGACGADADLVDLARACLTREPGDRPRDAGAVADRTTAYLAGVQEKLRAAERDRAVAEAGAAAERRRRKLQAGLAVSVLALTILGSLSTTSYLRQRQARAATVAQFLGEARIFRDQARAHPDDTARWQVTLAAIQRVEDALGSGPGGDPETRRQSDALRDEARAGRDGAERDRRLLDHLVDIRSARADDPDGMATDAAYAEAFGEAGLDLAALSPAEAGELIKARPRATALVLAVALDDWAAVRRRSRGDTIGAKRLSDAARSADPDPWRGDLRASLEHPAPKARLTALQAVARSARFDALGAVSLNLLGKALDSSGDPAAAEAVLRAAQQRHPGDVWVNYDLARVLELRHRRDEAIRFGTAARSIRPETAHELAHVLEQKGELVEAIAVFQDLARLRPKNARHLACLGMLLKQVGRHEEAGPYLEAAVAVGREAIRFKPNDHWAHLNLGKALAAQGNRDDATAEFREAIRLWPDHAVAHYNLGVNLQDQGKLDDAMVAYGEAIRLEPDYAEAHNNLGLALKDQGKLDQAIAAYRVAIRLNPDLANPHNNLGNALQAQGKRDDAVAAFREAIRLKPDYALYHYNLGNALRAQERLDDAIAVYGEAIRLKPDYAEAYTNLGIALKAQGKLDDAIAAYGEAIRLKPDLAPAHNSLGLALQAQGNLDQAVAAFREAIRLKPDFALYHYFLGLGLDAKGRPEEAATAYGEAIRLKPDFTEAHTNLGNALRAQGRLDQAIAAYGEAIRLKPDYAEAHTNLGVTLGIQGKFEEGLVALRRARALAPPGSPVARSVPGLIQHHERLIALADRLPAVLKGEDTPRNAVEGLGFGRLCSIQGRHAAAARLWAAALTADPDLVGDGRQPRHRYSAACSAALAGCGKCQDDPPPDETARAELRQQALEWLKAERAAWARQLESGRPQARPTIVRTLRHWQQDPDLAGVRDAEALAQLPGEEPRAWRDLWSEVEALQKKAQGARP